uniref:cytochrome-c peroxidase n=1 Tax=Roseivirga sp. TaxID=1964215 RepID=UPI004047EE2F
MKNALFISGLMITLLFSCSNTATEIDELDTALTEDFSDVLSLPTVSYNYSAPDLPAHFRVNNVQNIDNTPNNNPVSNAGATLGRVLFYDKQLSANNSTACASCHLQEDGFADTRRLSVGFLGGATGRNSMGLANARYYNNGRFFWDERAANLEAQVLLPIQDEVEMGLTLSELVAKIQSTDYYQPLFQDAFGTTEVTENRISRALSQFVRSMVSYQAKFDVGAAQVNDIENNDFPNFSQLENLGKDLFFSGRTQCSNCHETVTFSGDQARNNGLDAVITDEGVGGVNGNNQDRGKFKVNSLRNIALTAPYMHDGRFATLRDVIQFYNNGIQNSPTLDSRLRVQNGQVRRMNLNGQEIDALVAFLNTLTDEAFVRDEKFSNPFVVR